MPRRKSKRVAPKPQGISSNLKKQLQASVWSEERHKASNELHGVRWKAEKIAGDAAVRAHIKKKGWEKYNKDKNPYGKRYEPPKPKPKAKKKKMYQQYKK